MADQVTVVRKGGGMQRFMFMKRYWSEIGLGMKMNECS